jgi:hypothetical protein
MTEDRGSEIKAITLLDNYLYEIDDFEEESGIDKKKLANMYMESRNIVRQNLDDFELSRAADLLWLICIRVVWCFGVIGRYTKNYL